MDPEARPEHSAASPTPSMVWPGRDCGPVSPIGGSGEGCKDACVPASASNAGAGTQKDGPDVPETPMGSQRNVRADQVSALCAVRG